MSTKTLISILCLLSAVLATPVTPNIEARQSVDNSSTVTVVSYRDSAAPCSPEDAVATQTVVSDSCVVVPDGSTAGSFVISDLDPIGATEGEICAFTAYTDLACTDSFIELESEVFPAAGPGGAGRCEVAPDGDTIGSVSLNCAPQAYGYY